MLEFIYDEKYKKDLIPTLLTEDVDRVVAYINETMPDFICHIKEFEEESVSRVSHININFRTNTFAIRQFNAMDLVGFFQENYPDVLEKADYEAMYWAYTIFNNINSIRLQAVRNNSNKIETFCSLHEYVSRAIKELKSIKEYSEIKRKQYKKLPFDNLYYEGRDLEIVQTRKNNAVIKEQIYSDCITPKQSHINKHYLGSDMDYEDLDYYNDLSEKIHLTYAAVLSDNPDIEYNKELLDDLQELCEQVLQGYYFGRPDGTIINLKSELEKLLENSFEYMNSIDAFKGMGQKELQITKKLLKRLFKRNAKNHITIPQRYINNYQFLFLDSITHPYNIYLSYLNWCLTKDESKLHYFLRLVRIAQETMLHEEEICKVIDLSIIEERLKKESAKHSQDRLGDAQRIFYDDVPSLCEYVPIDSILKESVTDLVNNFVDGAVRVYRVFKAKTEYVIEELNEYILNHEKTHELLTHKDLVTSNDIKLLYQPTAITLYESMSKDGMSEKTVEWVGHSKKYTFRTTDSETESYGIAEGLLCPLKHPYSFMRLMGNLYSFFQNGYWNEDLKGNNSYWKMLSGDQIGSKELGKNHYNWKLKDVDFKTYMDTFDYYNDWWSVYEYIDKVYRLKRIIGQCLELCIWVNNVKKLSSNSRITGRELFSIISDMRSYAYVDDERMLDLERRLDFLEHNGEDMTTKAFIKTIFGTLVNKFTDLDQLTEIIDQKRQLVEMAWFKGVKGNEIGNYCLSILEKRLNILLEKTDEYENSINQIRKKIDYSYPRLKAITTKLYGNEPFDFEKIITATERMIAAGETLYLIYVFNESNVILSDYGCVAIEYYKALEYIVNQLLYKPYYLNILRKCDASSYDEFEKRLKMKQSEEERSGRCGESFRQMTYISRGFLYYKDELEYGIIARFYKNIRDEKDNTCSRDGCRLSNQYKQIRDFYTNAGLNISSIRHFGELMASTSNYRNQCAHPKIQSKDFAMQARKTIYNKEGDEKSLKADDIFELLFKFLEILQ